MDSPTKVAQELEETLPLAVIYGQADLAIALGRALKKQKIRVLHLREETEALSILEKPTYIFFLARPDVSGAALKTQLDEAYISSSRSQGKLILILDNLNERQEQVLLAQRQKYDYPLILVEIRGAMDGSAGSLTEGAVTKIIRLAFSAHNSSRQVIIGKNIPATSKAIPAQRMLSTQDVFNRLNKYQRKKRFPSKKLAILASVILVLGLVFAPIFLFGLPTIRAFYRLNSVKEELLHGRFDKAEELAIEAKKDLSSAKDRAHFLAFGAGLGLATPLEKYYDALLIAETIADSAIHVSRLGPKAILLPRSLSENSGNLASIATDIHREIVPLDENLGMIEAQATSFTSFGLPLEFPRARAMLTGLDRLLSVWQDIVPAQGQKTYLIIFQNSTELRPTGGFIGSYGLVKFDNGKLTDWKIEDIYSADGQLRGQISPPDEILHFLGQPSWYMRDANWAADWPLTSARLLWFLEKETGTKADGVIAVNLGTVQKLLAATGPLALTDLGETVSADDFFAKAEYSSEINFFAGSTAKKDFLGSVARAILEKLSGSSDKNWLALGRAAMSALEEKDIMFFFNSQESEKAILENGWGGSVECQGNCLMLVEANMGANKSNYFIKRSMQTAASIGKGGEIDMAAVVRYRNDSPSEAWPGGVYKNYLRFLVPLGSQLIDFDLGDGRKPLVSKVLTADELARPNNDQFFVYQTTESGFTSFGTFVEIPIQSDQTVVFRYRPPVKVTFGQEPTFTLHVLRQPGTGADPLDLTLDYPLFLTPKNSGAALSFSQKLIYNSDLRTDRTFEVRFKSGF